MTEEESCSWQWSSEPGSTFALDLDNAIASSIDHNPSSHTSHTHTLWSFHDLPCAVSPLPVSSALLPVLPLVLLPEEVTLAATVTQLPAATFHGKPLTMPLSIQLDRH